jgi:succinate dehydrogenase/fumarate reductase flavoprotein subunit
MTYDKLQELKERMRKHKVINDVAIVELTAKELNDLLELAEFAYYEKLARQEGKHYRIG